MCPSTIVSNLHFCVQEQSQFLNKVLICLSNKSFFIRIMQAVEIYYRSKWLCIKRTYWFKLENFDISYLGTNQIMVMLGIPQP